jgi:thiol-disulfide isomerase/thioredoxin
MPAPTTPEPPVSERPTSRRWLLSAAAAAGLAGAATAWWRYQPTEVQPSALDDLWARQFDNPEGQPVVLADFKGKPLLLNFWATWCPPCVEEMPLLSRFRQANADRGWQVLGLAVDQPAAVRRFLQAAPVSFPVAMAGLAGTDLARSLGNATGGLPFTVVVDGKGRIAARKLGQVSEADLAKWVEQIA